jgi:hypothetical protein
MRYIHFTDEAGARDIADTGFLLKSSILNGVFAVAEGGSYVPGVQKTILGRPRNRNVAVVFEARDLPDVAFPEEVIWHMEKLPVHNVVVASVEEARALLDNSLPVRMNDTLDIPLHPSIVDRKSFERIRLKKESVAIFFEDLHHREKLRKLKLLSGKGSR